MDLPVYELTLAELEQGIDATALVENPAIQRNWMAFNEVKQFKFETHDTEKQILAGALIVADFPMYRNVKGKEFYVKFSGSTIEQLADRMVLNDKLRSFNIEHDSNKSVPDLHIQQMFIIDSKRGINTPLGMETLPDGSLFAFVKVNNKQIWDEYVKTGIVKGFSIEGNFDIDLALKHQETDELTKLINENMNLKEKLEAFLAKFEGEQAPETPQTTELTSATLTDGTIIMYEGELAEGTIVTLEDGTPAPDGEHTTAEGIVISVLDGTVIAVAQPMTEQEMKVKELEETKTKLESEIESLKSQFANQKTEIETKFSAEISKLKDANKELVELTKEFIANESKHEFKQQEAKPKTHVDGLAKIFDFNRKQNNKK
jgi:uncharacterized membrane-anchored protein YhcB (DUF1043 family)